MTTPPSFEFVRYDVAGPVATITLNRPEYAYANRVAENNPAFVRIAKLMMNKAQDIQGYSNHLEDALGDYLAMDALGGSPMAEGVRRLASVDLAVRHRRGDRYGLTPPEASVNAAT